MNSSLMRQRLIESVGKVVYFPANCISGPSFHSPFHDSATCLIVESPDLQSAFDPVDLLPKKSILHGTLWTKSCLHVSVKQAYSQEIYKMFEFLEEEKINKDVEPLTQEERRLQKVKFLEILEDANAQPCLVFFKEKFTWIWVELKDAQEITFL